jgi:RNA polymerase sigma factor (sigma-70 family)
MDTAGNVEGFRETVFTLCFRVLRHRQDAEDACQEVLLKIARHGSGETSAWVHQIALRTAIDHRRAKLRRSRREAVAAEQVPAVAGDAEATIAEALSELPEEDRTLLVDHFFARKTLRALADERGCSEPAVWKRVEKGKERLRKVLLAAAPAAVVALESFLEASPTRPGPLRLALAVGVPAVIVAGIAMIGFARRTDEPLPALRIGTRPSPTAVAVDVRVLPQAAPANPELQPAAPAEIPPWPYELPPRHWSEAKRAAWFKLERTRLDLSADSRLFHEILADVSTRSGIPIRLAPDVPVPDKPVTFKVKDLIVRNTVKLLMSQFELDYDLDVDGTLWIRSLAGGPLDPDPRFHEIAAARAGLDQAIRTMEGGKQGAGPDPLWTAIRSKEIDLGPGTYRLLDLVDLLRETSGQNLHISGIELPALDPETGRSEREAMRRYMDLQRQGSASSADLDRLEQELSRLGRETRKKTPQRPFAGGRRSMEAHLEELSRVWEIGWFPTDGVLLITPSDKAAEGMAQAREEQRMYAEAAARLQQPLLGSAPRAVFQLADALSRETGLPVIPSEKAWTAPISTGGATWKAVLESLPAQGFRWILVKQTVYIDR